MRATLRSLTFGLAATLAGALSAQYPYTLVVQGTIAGCVPFQQVNIATLDGAQPSYNYTLEVFPFFCTYDTILHFSSTSIGISVSTMCNGMLVTAYDSASFNFIGDTAILVIDLACNGGGNYDCFGVLNGPSMPGTACNDGNPMTINDVWSPQCVCVGQEPGNYDCLGLLNGPAQPGTACTDTILGQVITGTWDMNCLCMVNSQLDCLGNPGGGALPGTPCVNFFGLPGIWTPDCLCDTDTDVYDCEGVLNGPALPGTVCVYTPDSGNTFITGIWSVECLCADTLNTGSDCLGIVNGPNLPGTACTIPGTTLEGTWSFDCICVPDSNGFLYDCNGVLNGPDMPGMPCDDLNPATTNDTWNSACVCVGTSNVPCQADFWVIQAMGPDSLPVPYELWVWNLSSGGSGNFTFNWNFGDGTSSTEAFPTHTYAGNGPYVLCLTIVDNNNCTSTHCDSVSINGDGIYEGMIIHADDRQDGFTINVQNPNANAVQEIVASNNIAFWPNPAVDELNVAVVSELSGLVNVTITDLDGRVVMDERMSLGGGRSQLRLSTSGLGAGMYLLRITDGSVNLSQRFVKTN